MGASRNLSYQGSHPITAFYQVVKSGAEVISLGNTDRVILLTVLDKFKAGLGIAFSPDGAHLTTGTETWDLTTRKTLPQVIPQRKPNSMVYSRDGKMMAASVDQVINLFGINKQE